MIIRRTSRQVPNGNGLIGLLLCLLSSDQFRQCVLQDDVIVLVQLLDVERDKALIGFAS